MSSEPRQQADTAPDRQADTAAVEAVAIERRDGTARAAYEIPKNLAGLLTVIQRLLLAWAFAFCYSALVTRYINVQQQHPLGLSGIALFSALILVVLAVLTWRRYNWLALGFIVLIASVYLLIEYSGYRPADRWRAAVFGWQRQLVAGLEWMVGFYNWARTGGGPTDIDLGGLSLTITGLLSVTAYLVIARFNMPLITLAMTAILFFVSEDMPWAVRVLFTAPPAAIALAMLARRIPRGRRLLGRHLGTVRMAKLRRALPGALAVILLALMVVHVIPAEMTYSHRLNGLADDLRRTVTDSEASTFSLSQSILGGVGYYPLGNRLGGPVFVLSDEVQLEVRGTTDGLLLRGTSSAFYDGRSWHPAPDDTYYRLGSPVWREQQEKALDEGLPTDLPGLPSTDWPRRDYRIELFTRTPRTQYVYAEGRLREAELVGNRQQIMFRMDGSVFALQPFGTGQQIRVRSTSLLSGSLDFQSVAARAHAVLGESARNYPEEISALYLQIPGSQPYQNGGSLYNQVERLVSGVDGDFAKVSRLAEWLRESFTYNLVVSYPPPDTDFVSWFLQTGEGYCVYFATALTMLSRLAGVPARYVEGYYAPPTSTDEQLKTVTGAMAHAWAEVYLTNVGWVPVDATPGGPAAAIISYSPGAVTPTPSPTAGPTVEPSDFPEPIEPTFGPNPPSFPVSPETSSRFPWTAVWVSLFIGAVPILFVIWAYQRIEKSHDRIRMRRTVSNPNRLARFYWRQIDGLARDLRMARGQSETLRQYVNRNTEMAQEIRVDSFLGQSGISLDLALIGIETSLYGQRPPNTGELDSLAAWYGELEGELRRQLPGPLFWLRRIFSTRFPWRLG